MIPSFTLDTKWKSEFPQFAQFLHQSPPPSSTQFAHLLSPSFAEADREYKAEEQRNQSESFGPANTTELESMEPSVWFSSDVHVPLPSFVQVAGWRWTYERFWDFLYGVALLYEDTPSEEQKSQLQNDIQRVISLLKCEHCKEHAKQIVKQNPPDCTNKRSIVQWLWWWKNQVRISQGKPAMDFDRALLSMCHLQWDEAKKELILDKKTTTRTILPFSSEETQALFDKQSVYMHIFPSIPPHLTYKYKAPTPTPTPTPTHALSTFRTWNVEIGFFLFFSSLLILLVSSCHKK